MLLKIEQHICGKTTDGEDWMAKILKHTKSHALK